MYHSILLLQSITIPVYQQQEAVWWFIPIIAYAALAGYIDYVTESGYVSAGTKVFSTPYIYDCSTVDFGSTITLSDGNYMAVGTHSLVKL